MNTVIAVLRKYIAEPEVSFIFPSQVSAGLWARKTCIMGIARSVAANRFLAWDRFKEEVFRELKTGKEPASALTRKLFAEYLLRKNAGSVREGVSASFEGFPLKSLIPPQYAEGGGIFASFMARLLPSLSQWEKLMKRVPEKTKDTEDEDYETVKKEYAAFLDQHNLFEPSWEEIKPAENGGRYVLFFPELIEDFSEYDAMLTEPQFIRVKAESAGGGEGPSLLFYQSAREEIRGAVTELRRLHEEEGIPYEDMAVSVPGLEETEPWLLREFFLRGIPVIRRAGKKLGETGAGRLFSLVNECAASRFSFNSLKALILNDHIPWREKKKNSALIDFGIAYNCVSSYTENGAVKDIWEEAFREGYNRGGKELQPYYRELKKRVLDLAGAENFKDIQKYYFAFRGYASEREASRSGLLDMEKIAEEDNAVLSRCVAELGSLIELEETLNDPALVPASPFGFYLSHLGEIEYVRAGQKPGVNIFKWRVAAASPFSCHFVLNASQNAASVLYQPMKFLRQDKRKALRLEDRDASGAFFLLCDTGEDAAYKPHVRISASAQTFSGWAIPHSFFARGKTENPPPLPEDPYRAERRFWRELEKSGPGAEPELKTIFLPQKKSFALWKNTLTLKEKNFSLFDSPVPEASPVRNLLEAAILNKDGFLPVSPTGDLNVYYECPLSWLYKKVFRAGEYNLEAVLLDDTALGNLYHIILEKLFSRIKNGDTLFNSLRLDIYKNWALEITAGAIREERAFRGPLAVPLLMPQSEGIAKKISRLLELEAKSFDGYRIAELELPVNFKTGKLLINGRIDRVSISPNGEPVIIDYKTSYLPEQTKAEELEKKSLSEFQIPLYIKLYEDTHGADKVQGAFFYRINNPYIKTAMGEKSGGKSKPPCREEYGPFLDAAEKQTEEFARKINTFDFTPRNIRPGDCSACVYKTACRSAYFLNSQTAFGKKEN